MKKLFVIGAGIFLSLILFLTLFSSLLGIEPGMEQNVEQILLPASSRHWFGTDSLGRDLFSRVIVGGRISLFVGVICALMSLIFGVVYGAIAGWREGFVDRVMMRFCDIFMALPSFILVAVLVLTLQLTLPFEDIFIKHFLSLCLGIFSTHWMTHARSSRSMVLEIRRKSFVEAALVIGGGTTHVLKRHVLPHMMSTLLVITALQIPSNIVYEGLMSFIGLGIQPPLTSWGVLVSEGWKTLSSFPHLILFPSFMLFMTVWSIHVLLDHVLLGHFQNLRRL